MIEHFPNLRLISISNANFINLDFLAKISWLHTVILDNNNRLVDISTLESNKLNKIRINHCSKIDWDNMSLCADEIYIDDQQYQF